MKTIYVYDRNVGKVVEKRSSQGKIEWLPQLPPQWGTDYLDLMQDYRDIMDGCEPRSRSDKSKLC